MHCLAVSASTRWFRQTRLPQSGYYLPQLDPDQGFCLATADLGAAAGWTWYLVWSRPNWRQGVAGPITLLSAGGTTILQADGVSGAGDRLMLFSGAAMRVLTSSLERRHTHSIIIRNTPGAGVDAWLDGNQVASGVASPLSANAPGALFVLHSGVSQGGAQCWFHEAASWSRAITSSEITTLLACAARGGSAARARACRFWWSASQTPAMASTTARGTCWRRAWPGTLGRWCTA